MNSGLKTMWYDTQMLKCQRMLRLLNDFDCPKINRFPKSQLYIFYRFQENTNFRIPITSDEFKRHLNVFVMVPQTYWTIGGCMTMNNITDSHIKDDAN